MWGIYDREEAEKFRKEPGTHPHYKKHHADGDDAEERPMPAAAIKGPTQVSLRLMNGVLE